MEAGSSTQNSEATDEVISLQTDHDEKGHQHQPSSPPFTQLPTEVLHNIFSLLRNRDIKQLRLSCRFFARVALLRIHRVFLSANPLNIQVFRAIADHEGYRHGVVELVYDDASLRRSPFEVNAARQNFLYTDPRPYLLDGILDADDWFENECSDNIPDADEARAKLRYNLSFRERAKMERAATQMPYEACWTYYQDLIRQQDEVIASNADMEALLYGLERFPCLKTVVVTPAAHGYLFEPLYETPMIRAFPHGFNYYISRGWPTRRAADVRVEVLVDEPGPWVGEDESLLEKIKSPWRGCLLVFRALAQVGNHHVSELLIDSNQLETGLSCRMFDEPCDAYTDLVSVLERPGMRRFHISLLVDHQWGSDWSSFRSGLLRKALAKCMDMEHFALTTDMYDVHEHWDIFPPLETVIPIQCWPRLQHLKLWNLLVNKAQLINFLAQLPPTLRSLELSLLNFNSDPGEDYYHLLCDMRDTLGWGERLIQPRIKIAVRDNYQRGCDSTVVLWLENEVDEYLYGQGGNPFQGLGPDQIPKGIGIIRDALYPDFETTPALVEAEQTRRFEIAVQEMAQAQQNNQK